MVLMPSIAWQCTGGGDTAAVRRQDSAHRARARAVGMKRAPLAKTPRWTTSTPRQESGEPAAETCPLGAIFTVVQDMLSMKYGQQLDESDFLSKAEARIGSDDCFDPAVLAAALNSEPALRIHDAAHERLIQLELQVHAVSSFDELRSCIQRWPGTACAVVALSDGGTASGNEQVVAAYREAYGDQNTLVGKTRVKSTGRAGPLRAFGEEGFVAAVVLDPIIARMLRYECEPNLMVDLQLPPLSAEYGREIQSSPPTPTGGAASLAERTCRVLEGLGPATGSAVDRAMEASAASGISLSCELMREHSAHVAVQAAGCSALRRLIHLAARSLPASEGRDCIELIAAAMRRHVLSQQLQETACIALASIVQVFPELQAVVATNGGIEQVVAAMGRYPDAPILQTWACGALAALAAKHPMNQSAVAASRGLEAIARSMQEHPDNAELQVMACGAFGNLAACHTNNQTAIASGGGLDRITDAMRLHVNSVNVQQSAIAAIWCLVNDHPENQALACSLEATGLISLAVQRFGGLPEGQHLKPTAAGALQVLVPGFSSALTAATSIYTARAFALPSERGATGAPVVASSRGMPRPPNSSNGQGAAC